MQCNCGGMTLDRQSVRKGIGKLTWPECADCGRVGLPFVFFPDGQDKQIHWRIFCPPGFEVDPESGTINL